jgi:hypothetical protein
VFGLDAAAATTGDHPDHAIKYGDEEQSRDEAQHQNVHSGHSAGVHGCYEASNLLQLAEASDQLVSGWFTAFPQCSEHILNHLGSPVYVLYAFITLL